VRQKRGVNPSKNGEEVLFEVLYHLLGFVSPVHVWRHQLKLDHPCFCDDSLEVFTGLIIPDIEIHRKPASSQPCHDCVESWNAVFACLCLERLS
jgi:hypothetical protein